VREYHHASGDYAQRLDAKESLGLINWHLTPHIGTGGREQNAKAI
jgi:hypothetical protein